MKITERHNDYGLYIEFYNYTTAFMHVHGQRHPLLLVAPTDRMFEDGSSFLQCPRRTLPSPSPSTKPGGAVHQGFSGTQEIVQGNCCFCECHNIFWFGNDRTSICEQERRQYSNVE